MSKPNVPSHKLKMMTDADLDRLSQNPRNRVYQYKYGETIEEMPAARVRHIVLTLLSFSHQYSMDPDHKNCSEADIRAAACKSNEMFAKFSKTHKTIFEECTKSKMLSSQELDILLSLIKLKEKEQNKQLTSEEACSDFMKMMTNKDGQDSKKI
jgi:hypothetical protein